MKMEFMDSVKKHFDKREELYYLDEKSEELEENENLIKIFESDPSMCGENYVIYKIVLE